MPRRATRSTRRAEQALPVEAELARVRLVQTRHDVEERRLPRAVRPDQPDDLAGVDVQGDVVDRHDAAEPARDVANFEQRHRAGTLRQRCRVGHRQAADEPLTDVDGREAVDQVAAGEQRHVVGGTEGDDVGRRRPLDRRAGHRGVRRPQDGELAMRRQVLVERDQRPAERRRGPGKDVRDQPQYADGVPLELVVRPRMRACIVAKTADSYSRE